MKKLTILLFFFLLFVTGVVNAQAVSKKWVIVQDLDDRIVYLDTTTIREFDSKLTVWSLVIYREPKEINSIQQKVAQIKSQFMINEPFNKYSVIGTLYYDSKGKMIGETSLPNYSYSNDNLSIPIVEGSTIDVLRNKAKDYITTGKFANERSEFLKNYDKNVVTKDSDINKGNENTKQDSTADNKGIDDAAMEKLKEVTQAAPPVKDTTLKGNKTGNVESVKKDTMKAGIEGMNELVNTKIDSTKIKAMKEKSIPKDSVAAAVLKKEIAADSKDESIQKIEADTVVPEKKEGKAVNKKENKKAEVIKTEEPPVSVIKKEEMQTASTSEYDFAKETNPTGVIFTDGKLYCFQVSSWKTRAQAEKEVSRLKDKGHNAFIQEAELGKKGTWYRVRIGFFNSLKEAVAYRKKVR